MPTALGFSVFAGNPQLRALRIAVLTVMANALAGASSLPAQPVAPARSTECAAPIAAAAVALTVRGPDGAALSDAVVLVLALGEAASAPSPLTKPSAEDCARALTRYGGRVRVMAPGFAPQVLTLAAADERQGRAIVLQPQPTATLLPVAVVASRGGATTPVTVSTVDAAALQQRAPGQELPVLLSTLPGVIAASDAGIGMGYSYFRVRGMDQTRVNVTLDGIPMAEPEDQGFYAMNFVGLTSQLQSVALQRGVGTTRAGTASYAGALSLATPALRDVTPGGTATWRQGSFGLRQASTQWRLATAGPIGWRGSVGGTWQTVDGFRRESGNRSASVLAQGGYLGRTTEVRALFLGGTQRNDMAYLAADEATLARDLRANPLTPDENDAFTQRLGAVTVAHTPSRGARWSLTGYGGDLSGQFDVRADATTLMTFGLTSGRVGALGAWERVRGPWQWLATANVDAYRRTHVMGLRADGRAPRGPDAYRNRGDKVESSVSAKALRALGPATLFADAAVRTPRFAYTPDRGAGIAPQARAWTFLNPSGGLTLPTRVGHAYVSVGETQREPTRSDLFAGFDNVDTTNVAFVGPLTRVRAERVRNLELGLRDTEGSLQWDATAFIMQFRNEIAPIGQLSVIGLPLRENVARSRRQGLEGSLRWASPPTPTRARLWAIDGTLSLLDARIAAFQDGTTGARYTQTRSALSPVVTATHSLRLVWRGLGTVEWRGRYWSAAALDNTGRASLRVPPSYVAQLQVVHNHGPWRVDATVGNLLNRRAFASGTTDGTTRFLYPEATRHVVVSATWTRP